MSKIKHGSKFSITTPLRRRGVGSETSSLQNLKLIVSLNNADRETGHGGETANFRGPEHAVHPSDCLQFTGEDAHYILSLTH